MQIYSTYIEIEKTKKSEQTLGFHPLILEIYLYILLKTYSFKELYGVKDISPARETT